MQWTVDGRRGRRGRRAVPTVDVIVRERATIQRRSITDDTVSAATSTPATVLEHSVEVLRPLYTALRRSREICVYDTFLGDSYK